MLTTTLTTLGRLVGLLLRALVNEIGDLGGEDDPHTFYLPSLLLDADGIVTHDQAEAVAQF